jgi:hypothetical protein
MKRNVEKVWGSRYTLGSRYLSKNTVYIILFFALFSNFIYIAKIICIFFYENRVRGKPEKRQFERSGCRWEGNIETDPKLSGSM